VLVVIVLFVVVFLILFVVIIIGSHGLARERPRRLVRVHFRWSRSIDERAASVTEERPTGRGFIGTARGAFEFDHGILHVLAVGLKIARLPFLNLARLYWRFRGMRAKK